MGRPKHSPAAPMDSTRFVGVTACPVQCRRGITVHGHTFVGGEESILAVGELSPAAFAWLSKVPTMTLVEYESKPNESKPKAAKKKSKRAKPTTPVAKSDDLDFDSES